MKWIVYLLLSVIVWMSLKHGIELDKLEMQLQWAESKECVKPPETKCPEPIVLPPKIITVPELCPEYAPCPDCPECERCPTWWDLCDE